MSLTFYFCRQKMVTTKTENKVNVKVYTVIYNILTLTDTAYITTSFYYIINQVFNGMRRLYKTLIIVTTT